MSVVSDYLAESKVQYFATVGVDGSPKVRPFQFMVEEGGKLYFCTSNKKTVFKEMEKTPRVEICASGKDSSWLRLSGRPAFVSDLGLKARIQDSSPLVKSIYQRPDNPDFEIFYLADAVATIADFSGAPPRKYSL